MFLPPAMSWKMSDSDRGKGLAHRALARVVDEQDDRPSEHLVAEERFGDKHLPADRYHVVGFDLEYIRVG